MDFKSSPAMYFIAGAIILFVIAQSLFFLIKAWRHGKKIGISAQTLRNTVSTSAVFTIAPAIAILATVITLAGALGLVVPWLRLSVIGNITYEATAAQAAMDALNHVGGMAVEVTDKKVFTAVVWVMTVGSVFPLVLLPIVAKPLQKKLSGIVSKSNSALPDIISAAAFIGLIGAFIARSVAGSGNAEIVGDGAGVLSVITLISAIIFSLLLDFISKRFNVKWLKTFAMPLGMLAAMGVAILMHNVLPENIALLEWRG